MPIGIRDIPELQLEVFQELIELFKAPPKLVLSNLFGKSPIDSDSDTISWYSQVGNRGMTPFAYPGGRGQKTAPTGVSEHRAKAAYWKELMEFGEEFMNNMRDLAKPTPTKKNPTKFITDELQTLKNRCDRRQEWMFSQMAAYGGFKYYGEHGVHLNVDYGFLPRNFFTLDSATKWNGGVNRNIVKDISDWKLRMLRNNGEELAYMLMTSEIVQMLQMDEQIRELVKPIAFGKGNLFAAPKETFSELFQLPNIIVYDEVYDAKAWIAQPVIANVTTNVFLNDVTPFEVGDVVKLLNKVTGDEEERTITAIDTQAGFITINSAPTLSYRSGVDQILTYKTYLPKDRVVLFTPTVEGKNIATFMRAPFGLSGNYGPFIDQKDEWEPDARLVRIQHKGLPILYHRDAIMSVKVVI